MRRAARESRRRDEAWAWLAETASRVQVESWEWRAARAYRTGVTEAPGEQTARADAAQALKTRACMRSVPVERAAAMPGEALMEKAARKPVERRAQ